YLLAIATSSTAPSRLVKLTPLYFSGFIPINHAESAVLLATPIWVSIHSFLSLLILLSIISIIEEKGSGLFVSPSSPVPFTFSLSSFSPAVTIVLGALAPPPTSSSSLAALSGLDYPALLIVPTQLSKS